MKQEERRIKFNYHILTEKTGVEFLKALKSIFCGKCIYQTIKGNILDYGCNQEEEQAIS